MPHTFLKLLDKLYKYEVDPERIVQDAEWIWFCPQLDGWTDRQIDGQCEISIPPFQLCWSGGIEMKNLTNLIGSHMETKLSSYIILIFIYIYEYVSKGLFQVLLSVLTIAIEANKITQLHYFQCLDFCDSISSKISCKHIFKKMMPLQFIHK